MTRHRVFLKVYNFNMLQWQSSNFHNFPQYFQISRCCNATLIDIRAHKPSPENIEANVEAMSVVILRLFCNMWIFLSPVLESICLIKIPGLLYHISSVHVMLYPKFAVSASFGNTRMTRLKDIKYRWVETERNKVDCRQTCTTVGGRYKIDSRWKLWSEGSW